MSESDHSSSPFERFRRMLAIVSLVVFVGHFVGIGPYAQTARAAGQAGHHQALPAHAHHQTLPAPSSVHTAHHGHDGAAHAGHARAEASLAHPPGVMPAVGAPASTDDHAHLSCEKAAGRRPFCS
ncbi:MAG: hypothetical protein R3E83_06150 [Burkholderiaceae bacterium]